MNIFKIISSTILILGVFIVHVTPKPGFLGLDLDLDLPLLSDLLQDSKQTSSPQKPLLPILPNTGSVQLPLVGNLLNTPQGLLGLANTNPGDLLKLNLSISPLGLGINQTKFICPEPLGIFPDPEDCSSFYICVLGIVELKLSCSTGYHYEPNLLGLCIENDPISLPETCNHCITYKKPSTCTLSPYNCSFCLEKSFVNFRCDSYNNLINFGCNDSQIYNKTIDKGNNNRRIDPYENNTNPLYISLLPGDKKNFTITFKLTSHPLDVYFLMDISGSMGDDKANVVALSTKLINVLGNLTKDYTLGFGAFSDKVDAYTFRNILPLSNNTTNFSRIVDSTQILWGGDYPEDAGTAMYEAAICEKEIGWRTFTRRLIFVLTDATFHYAKDGSGGYTGNTSFDGKCHLDSSGIYTEKLSQDYPSISQLIEIISEKQITILFGIVSGIDFYQNISKQLQPSGIGILSHDSSNLIDLLDTEYKKIASRVELKNSNSTKEIQIKYYSNCNVDKINSTTTTTTKGSSTTSETETTLCEGLPYEGEITFTVQISLKECPKNIKDWKQTIKFSVPGLPHYVEVPIELICGDWEK